MAITGFMLWFPVETADLFGDWIVPIAKIIHYYEAWLATLAIIFWHFFFVIFHPEQYPMNFVWLRGKMSREETKMEHPGWYSKLLTKKDQTE